MVTNEGLSFSEKKEAFHASRYSLVDISDESTGSYRLMNFFNRACLYARDFKQLYDTINKAAQASAMVEQHMDIVMHFARMRSKLLAGVSK